MQIYDMALQFPNYSNSLVQLKLQKNDLSVANTDIFTWLTDESCTFDLFPTRFMIPI